MEERTRPAAPERSLFSILSVGIGLLVVLFLAYEFVGSNLIYSRSQQLLLTQFKDSLSLEKAPAVKPGDALGILAVPSIGLESVIVEGTTPGDLEKGLGHFRSSPFPGQAGNVVLAGRRTTFGSPLRRIEEFKVGDTIVLSSRRGIFEYVVEENRVIKPGAPDVVTATQDNRLTIVTSHPAYLAQGRRAVSAILQGEPAPTRFNAGPFVMERNEMGLSGDSGAIGEVIVLLQILGLVLVGAAVAYRRRVSRAVYLLSAPLVLLLLFLVFDQINRLLPATL